jgi:hypothetical protein
MGVYSDQLIEVEARRAERSLHPDAMDLYFQGMAYLNKGRTPEPMAQSRGFFERALALDPNNVEALVGLAYVDMATSVYTLTDDRNARLAAAEVAVIKALSMAPQHARAHWFRTARPKALPNASRRWRWIETWPARAGASVTPSITLVAAQRPRPMSKRHFASVLAIRKPIFG